MRELAVLLGWCIVVVRDRELLGFARELMILLQNATKAILLEAQNATGGIGSALELVEIGVRECPFACVRIALIRFGC